MQGLLKGMDNLIMNNLTTEGEFTEVIIGIDLDNGNVPVWTIPAKGASVTISRLL